MSKIIVLLADGTGNSAAKLFKTNVWRLYQAVDVRDPPPAGATRQVAYYHDGVGTSAFKPLALLGGVFGVGLKRNVLEIYRFLCRNYQPGDRIYTYGFSRGAFTIRVLTGLVTTQGVLHCETEAELKRYAADAYRAYRRRYKLPIFGYKNKSAPPDPNPEQTKIGIVDRLRDLRDAVIAAWRKIFRHRQYSEVKRLEIPHIAFVGVWDTVAAYGLPIEELTRGIDEWVWPLSMPNYQLSPKVQCARHALSLDDERDTFHPLLWDELAEEELIASKEVTAGRLQQVWFAGVHSNVGGGHADDSLSYVPLHWMMRESEKTGLRFLPPELQELRTPPNEFGQLYDSRRGLAAYYRYQPRKITARLDPPDPTTLIMQDPNRNGRGLLKRVQVHESVFHRARAGNDRYAPIGLPAEYDVVGSDGTIEHVSSPSRADRQEWVWNDVWQRRVNYFTTVAFSAFLALLPFIHAFWPPSVCVGPQCLLTPVIEGLGWFLPGFLQSWVRAFAAAPGTFLLVSIVIALLMTRSANLKRQINDGKRELWAESLGIPLGPGRPATVAGRSTGKPDNWIYWLRSRWLYQTTIQWLKWRITPGVFGSFVLVGGLALIVALLVVAVQRGRLAVAERSDHFCKVGTASAEPSGALPQQFTTNSPCWSTGVRVAKGARYRISMAVTQPWLDKTIEASPRGFDADRMRWYLRPSLVLRRSLSGRWFQPAARVIRADGRARRTTLLEMSCACAGAPVYAAEFTAPLDGELFLFVNDVAIGPFGGPTTKYYDNNQGRAEVRIERLPQ